MLSGARREYEKLFARLAELGVPGTGDFFRRTPREIARETRALTARREREAETMAALAWLVGRYVALGVHAPRRYPAAPPGARARRAETDEDMKQVFLSLAKRR